jgi:hypothetical protein
MWFRLKPALSLVLLAPLIAEYLLGSLTFRQLTLFPLMALIYGAGALFIREVARRNGRGWPTVIMLGLAYGVIEEGLATQSLFNPHYLGLRLLDHGYIPALGIGAPWTAYVILLHAAWSIAVPVAWVEALFPQRRTAPWLGGAGFVISGIAYGLGVTLVAFGTWKKEHFAASGTQLAVTAGVAVMMIAGAFAFFRPGPTDSTTAQGLSSWRPWKLGLLAFAVGSVFHLVNQFGSAFLPPALVAVISLLLPASVIGVMRVARKSGAWTAAQTDALMLGGLLTYCWLGFLMTARLHGADTIPGQFVSCVIVLALMGGNFVRRRLVRVEAPA